MMMRGDVCSRQFEKARVTLKRVANIKRKPVPRYKYFSLEMRQRGKSQNNVVGGRQ